MFSECNVTNTRNGIKPETFKNKSDWDIIINSFECFLNEKYKRKNTSDAYLKDVKQYIDWYFSSNIDNGIFLDKENFSKYESYLKSVKKYKKNTITYKKVAILKGYKFLSEFYQHNENEKLSNYPKTNRTQYNYLTESYIRL